MARLGPARHLKRDSSPKFWPIPRKKHVWAVRTAPGPHALNESMPLLLILRDVLGYAESGKESKMLIKEGKIRVDGLTRRDERYPVGFMDIVELPDSKETFRVLPAEGRRMRLKPIKGEEAGFKLCRIVGKTTVSGGRKQLNLHDGRSIKLQESGAEYKVNDVLQMKIPEQEIMDHISFREGVLAVITGGRSQGEYGQVIGTGSEPGRKRTVTIRTPDGRDVRTLFRYVFAVGSEKPLISLTGGS